MALQEEKSSGFHAVTRNPFEIEIAAPGTVNETRERNRDQMTVKAAIAGMATPWLELRHCEEEIDGSAAMRPEAVGATALRADHATESPPEFRQRIPNTGTPCNRGELTFAWTVAFEV